jgi:hypothetical protein
VLWEGGCDLVRAIPLLYRIWSAVRRADGQMSPSFGIFY